MLRTREATAFVESHTSHRWLRGCSLQHPYLPSTDLLRSPLAQSCFGYITAFFLLFCFVESGLVLILVLGVETETSHMLSTALIRQLCLQTIIACRLIFKSTSQSIKVSFWFCCWFVCLGAILWSFCGCCFYKVHTVYLRMALNSLYSLFRSQTQDPLACLVLGL